MINKGIQKPNPDTDEEFGIVGATYYAVTESSSYLFTARQNLKYGSRKYNTLSAAEAALPATATAPIVINILGTWASPDTNAVTFDTTTDAINYILVRAIGNARHRGKWTDTAYRKTHTTGEIFISTTHTIKFEGIQTLFTTSSRTFDYTFSTGTGSVTLEIKDCILTADLSGTADAIYGVRQVTSGTLTRIINTVFSGFNNPGFSCRGIHQAASSTVLAYNCVFYNCGDGFYTSIGTTIAKNCIAQNCTDGFNGSFDASSDYNVSDIASDAPGSNSFQATVIFKDAANDDFHLDVSDSRLRGIGADLRSTFTKDIDGEIRDQTGAWDIGADEFISYTPTVYSHYVALNGTSDYIITPDSTANSVTGSIDIRIKIAADDWTPAGYQTPVAKWSSGTTISWLVTLQTDGKTALWISNNGVGAENVATTAALGYADGSAHWLRYVYNVSTTTGYVYESTDYDPALETGTWTQIGIDSGMTFTGLHDNASPVEIGSYLNGTSEFFDGKVYYVEVRDGIDGTIVARFNASEIDSSETYISNIDGEEKWTNNGGIYTSA